MRSHEGVADRLRWPFPSLVSRGSESVPGAQENSNRRGKGGTVELDNHDHRLKTHCE